MFSRIGENTLHIFGVVNFLSIPMVWALYPETANRTLEEMVSILTMTQSAYVDIDPVKGSAVRERKSVGMGRGSPFRQAEGRES